MDALNTSCFTSIPGQFLHADSDVTPTPMATETRLNTPQKVIISSLNAVKINAVKTAFTSLFPTTPFTFTPLKVPSEVPDQPLADAQTLQGALNRVRNAQIAHPDASYYVSLEGGIDGSLDDDELSVQSFAWAVVMGSGKEGRVGKARTAAYYLSRETVELMRGGMELGVANDVLYGTENSKQKGGSVGLLTGGVLDREGYYVQAVVLALVPFRNTHLTF